MKTIVLRSCIPAVVLVGLFAGPVAAEIYTCTDANGRTQYTDTPCGGDPAAIKPHHAAPAAPDHDARMEKTRRLLDAMEAERHDKQAAAEKAKAEKERRKRNCNIARDRYRRITEANRVVRLDEAGNRVVLNDAERAASTDSARKAMEEWCD